MGIPLGHKLKIIKRIKDIRHSQNQSTASISREGTTGAQQQSANKGSSLKDGTFDEGQSHNQFLEALNAWRNAPKEESKEHMKPQSSLSNGSKKKEGNRVDSTTSRWKRL